MMKTLLVILTSVAGLLLFSTTVCGLWIQYASQPVDASSIRFHMVVGLAAVLVSAIALVLGMIKA
jgi:hypothetical protein